MDKNISRRSFLKGAAVGAAGLTLAGTGLHVNASKAEDEIVWDETYDVVYSLVADDEELTVFVSAIEHCGNFKDLPEHTGWEMKKVYRLMEKLMRRIRAAKKNGLI